MADSSTLVIGFVALCFLGWAIAMTVLWYRAKDKKAATVAPGPSPSPCPPAGPAPAPDPQTVKKWDMNLYNTFMVFDSAGEKPSIKYTAKTCAEYAKTRGADGFMYRTDKHQFAPNKNTCVGLLQMPKSLTTDESVTTPPWEDLSGCVDSTKTWPKCGSQVSWCFKTPVGEVPKDRGASWGEYLQNIITGGPMDLPTFGDNLTDKFTFKTLKDIKNYWDTVSRPTLKSYGYKYVAVSMYMGDGTSYNDSSYKVRVAFGRTLPSMSTSLDEHDTCSYGGGSSSSTTDYKVGRQYSIYPSIPSNTKNPDDWDFKDPKYGIDTWRIYDLSQIV